MTLLSIIIAIVATLAGISLVYLTVLLTKWLRRKWRARREGSWKARDRRWRPRTGLFAGWVGQGSRLKANIGADEERRSLLGAGRSEC